LIGKLTANPGISANSARGEEHDAGDDRYMGSPT
jgi:hypothetical protein